MKTLNIHCLQHVAFEGPGAIGQWVVHKHHNFTITKLYDNHPLPEIDTVDLLIVLGGPMNVDDEPIFPWLKTEKAFIAACIKAGKTVLGICLGAQLIARACGQRVFPNAEKEIGWFEVDKNMAVRHPVAHLFPNHLMCFHWHGDTFDLPENSLLLASTKACRNQAFLLYDKVLGLQFHPEATPEWVAALMASAGHDLVTGKKYVQEAAFIQSQTAFYATANELMFNLLNYLEKTIVE